MSKYIIIASVVAMLALSGALMIGSFWGDAVTTDESPHTVAGYSYIKYRDFRINPEHPPLMKDLAGIPLQFLKLNFPLQSPSWTTKVNDQWALGPQFLYESGNNPDTIIRAARLGVMIIFFLFGFFIFKFTRKVYGTRVALLTLFLYAFSPSFLAHGRYVTTDVAAAFGFFIGIFYFLRYLKLRTRGSIIWAGVTLGIAMLLKFSLFLLIPFFIALTALAAIINWQRPDPQQHTSFVRNGLRLWGGLFIIFAVAALLIWVVYAYHVWNYPIERQLSDTSANLSTFGSRFLVNTTLALTNFEPTRPWAQYMHGLLMVVQRAAGGNTTYFKGEVASNAWKEYFPVMYLLKEQLGLHILTLIALATVFLGFKNWFKTRLERKKYVLHDLKEWLLNYRNFVTFTSLAFIAMYWTNSIFSNLNIGVRHVLPSFPFIYMLVSYQIIKWLEREKIQFNPSHPLQIMIDFFRSYFKTALKIMLVVLILVWYLLSALFTYPYYLAYFNELAGGPKNGYKYAADSNLDWGQDLKRLAQFVEENNIETIQLDYFGGGSPHYYLKEKFQPYWPTKGETTGWIAVSATLLLGQTGTPVRGFIRKPGEDYSWILQYTPVAYIGYSIFVFNIPEK